MSNDNSTTAKDGVEQKDAESIQTYTPPGYRRGTVDDVAKVNEKGEIESK